MKRFILFFSLLFATVSFAATGDVTFIGPGLSSVPLPTTTTVGGVRALTASSNYFLTGLGTDGSLTRALLSASNLTTGTLSDSLFRGVTNVETYGTLEDAVTAIGATSKILRFSTDQTLTGNLSIPATLQLVPINGAIINYGAYSFTYSGDTLYWPKTQVLAGSGTVSLSSAIVLPEWFGITGTADQVAINKAFASITGTGQKVVFAHRIYSVTASIIPKSYTKWEGAYGESNTWGLTTAYGGTEIVWAGGDTGNIIDATNVRLFKMEGFHLEGDSKLGVVGILLDSDNSPSGSQNEFHNFSIRECGIGVQWGTSGLGSSYANDGTRFSTFTIWSQIVGSKGFVINSGNAGQMSTIESGGIQVDDIGIDIVVGNLIEVRRVFGGGPLKTAFIRVAAAIDLLIEGCSSEGQGSRIDGKISNDSYFLLSVAPTGSYPVMQTVITMNHNKINNPILANYRLRINDLGNSWGTCYRITDDAVIPVTGSFTEDPDGISSVVALNNGASVTSPADYGWQDSAYVDLHIIDPIRGWSTPAFSAGDFTGNDAMYWTVEAADVETLAYLIEGRKMTVSFKVNTATVTGTPSTVLLLAIPRGKVATKSMVSSVRILDNGVTTTGICYTSVSSDKISIQREDLAAFTASSNLTTVQGQIVFEIN